MEMELAARLAGGSRGARATHIFDPMHVFIAHRARTPAMTPRCSSFPIR